MKSNLLRIFLLYLTSCIVSSAALADYKLNCSNTNYKQLTHRYTKSWGEGWVPNINTHEISGDKAYFTQHNKSGRVVLNNDTKLKIEYEWQYSGKSQLRTLMKLLYFKRTKKLNVSFFENGGFANSGDIWSECSLDKTSSNNSDNKTNNVIPQNSINKNNVQKKENIAKEINKTSDKIKIAEDKCSDIGFTKGTEKFGECVLKLIDFK